MKDILDRKYDLVLLYDFYGELLKEHNREIFEDYFLNDLSLSEIADERGISRQGVHDCIKRTSKMLEGYEHKLKLMSKYEKIKNKVTLAIDILEKEMKEEDKEYLIQIKKILDDILDNY